jgi:hypothetical protein|tara:strand:- start:162 stop:329 length:168 start_codon:yes stop_codon:yes gene_type:complete
MLNEHILKTLTDENGDPLKVNADNLHEVEIAISKAVACLRLAGVLGFNVDIIKNA